ncbi:MAG: hypothetical protein II200_03410 [Bacteroidaceae bacterium]|nr:hypothetical protein [Bacteroidaceae bacterium]
MQRTDATHRAHGKKISPCTMATNSSTIGAAHGDFGKTLLPEKYAILSHSRKPCRRRSKLHLPDA